MPDNVYLEEFTGLTALLCQVGVDSLLQVTHSSAMNVSQMNSYQPCQVIKLTQQ
jgi:hypothetical protein